MANNRKRKYSNNVNKHYARKKSTRKNKQNSTSISKESVNDTKNIDLAIDELFEKEISFKDNSKIDEIPKEKVNAFLPPKNILIETNPDETLEKNVSDEKIYVPYIPTNDTVDTRSNEKLSKDKPIERVEVSNTKKEENSTKEKTSDKHAYNVNSKRYFGYNERLLINVITIFSFLILSIVFLTSSISIKSKSKVYYNQSSSVDYKVYLKPNDYYKDPYLDKNMQYIASLIDNVDVNFSYFFNANQSINYKYSYYVKADVSVTDSQDKSKIIYSNSDKLTEPVYFTRQNSNGFNISQNVKVDYSKYNDLVKTFKSSYAISANSNLVLSLCVEIVDEKGNMIRSYDSSDSSKITIPLTEQMIDISIDSKNINNSNNVNIYKEFSIGNKLLFGLSIASFIIFIASIIKLIMFLNKTAARKTLYDLTLNKILKEYDRVIVNSKKIVDANENVIDVKNFNELLDVRDNLEKPIIFSEIHKGQKSIFVVKTPNETYRYVLKLSDLEEEKKNEKKA